MNDQELHGLVDATYAKAKTLFHAEPGTKHYKVTLRELRKCVSQLEKAESEGERNAG